MKIYLGKHPNFYHANKGHCLQVDLDQPTPLSVVLDDFGITLSEANFVIINGEITNLEEAIISERDEVKLISPVGGGW